MDQDLAQNEQMTWFMLCRAVEHHCAAQNELDAWNGLWKQQQVDRSCQLQEQLAAATDNEGEELEAPVKVPEGDLVQQARVEQLHASPPQDEVADHWSDLQSNEINQHLVKTT